MNHILVPYHLDESLPDLDVPLDVDVTVARELPDGDIWARMAALYDGVADAVAGAVERGETPVVMSGDCTTSLGVLAGLRRAAVAPSVVWFDAHGDVQTLETTTSGYLGGIPLRIIAGYRPELISRALGLTPVAEDQIVLVDARDLDPPEREYLDASAITRLPVEDVDADRLPAGPIYLHIDLDVVDPAELPGLLFPAEGGPPLTAVAAAVARVVATGRVAAVGLACTWHPGHGAANRVDAVTSALGDTP